MELAPKGSIESEFDLREHCAAASALQWSPRGLHASPYGTGWVGRYRALLQYRPPSGHKPFPEIPLVSVPPLAFEIVSPAGEELTVLQALDGAASSPDTRKSTCLKLLSEHPQSRILATAAMDLMSCFSANRQHEIVVEVGEAFRRARCPRRPYVSDSIDYFLACAYQQAGRAEAARQIAAELPEPYRSAVLRETK